MGTEDATARDLIQKGIELLVDRPAALLDGGLRSEDVINITNSSHATFYRKFGTKGAYLRAVSETLARSSLPSPIHVNEATKSALSESGGDIRHAIRTLTESHFSELSSQVATQRILLSIFADKKGSRDHYRRGDSLVLSIFELLFDKRGATLRKPFTTSSFAILVTALIDGFILRERADPTSVTPQILADAILMVVDSAVDLNQRNEYVDDYLRELDQTQTGLSESLPKNPRAALIESARREFSERGYFRANPARIAIEAHVPRSTAMRLFPTKAHLIVGALIPKYRKLQQEVDDDVLIGLGEITVLKNYLLRCARLVAEETTFMDALTTVVAHDTYTDPDGVLSIKRELNFPALITPVLERGQNVGTVSATLPASEIATVVTNALLLRCFAHRSASPEENAAAVSSLFLDGLAT